jgi:hypothetical protein
VLEQQSTGRNAGMLLYCSTLHFRAPRSKLAPKLQIPPVARLWRVVEPRWECPNGTPNRFLKFKKAKLE